MQELQFDNNLFFGYIGQKPSLQIMLFLVNLLHLWGFYVLKKPKPILRCKRMVLGDIAINQAEYTHTILTPYNFHFIKHNA